MPANVFFKLDIPVSNSASDSTAPPFSLLIGWEFWREKSLLPPPIKDWAAADVTEEIVDVAEVIVGYFSFYVYVLHIIIFFFYKKGTIQQHISTY